MNGFSDGVFQSYPGHLGVERILVPGLSIVDAHHFGKAGIKERLSVIYAPTDKHDRHICLSGMIEHYAG